MRKLEDIVKRQFTRSELDREFLRCCAVNEERAITETPIITLSRQMGSGGATIGKIVANELKFIFYDREIIEHIARETGSSKDHIARQEDTARDVVGNLVLNLLDSRHVTDAVYARSLIRILRTIAEEGRAVIIGRAGSCILPQSLRIRIVAPFELRVQRMALLRSIDEKAARNLVLETDHARKRFLRGFFGCDPNDALLYDLIINTGSFSLDHAAELIIARVRQIWKEG
ncbi:MAG: cytidylate kinase-like family protein [Armatimonadia bacterium]